MSQITNKTESGQSMLELIVVIAVSMVVITALVLTTISSTRNAQLAKNQAQATRLSQEALELVRYGRERNACIDGLPATATNSWSGGNSTCLSPGGGSIWSYEITSQCTPVVGTLCYFKVDPTGKLTYTTTKATFPTSVSEVEYLTVGGGQFLRAIIISDFDKWPSQKTVTSLVKWTDFAGSHESKQVTILRKLL